MDVSQSVWGDPLYLLISSGLKSDIWTMALACFWYPFAWLCFSTCSPLRQCLLSLMLRCIFFLAATNRLILVLVGWFVSFDPIFCSLCLSVVVQGSLVFRITIERCCPKTMSHSCQVRPRETKRLLHSEGSVNWAKGQHTGWDKSLYTPYVWQSVSI